MAKGKNQYVVPTQGGWGVKGEGNSKLTAKTDTKVDALVCNMKLLIIEDEEELAK